MSFFKLLASKTNLYEQKKELMKTISSGQVHGLCQLFKTILHGDVTMSRLNIKRMKACADDIRELIGKRTTQERRRQLVITHTKLIVDVVKSLITELEKL